MSNAWAAALLALTVTCASPAPPARLSPSERFVLPGSDGKTHDLGAALAQSTLTVFVFYSRDCPCLSVHEPRLASLARRYRERGVGWFVVNSEVGADAAEDAREAHRRAYPFPLLTDRDARFARAVHAAFATHAVVVDRSGRIRYSGAVDSDKSRLHDDAEPYLQNALDDVLLGREPRATRREPLGCALTLY